MSMQKTFEDYIADFISAIPIVDSKDMFFLSKERNGKEVDFVAFAPIKLTDLHIIFTIIDNKKDIYVTVTDGPVDDIATILDALQGGFEDSRTDRGDVLALKNEFLQSYGVFGLFFSRVRFYEFFDDIPDTFDFNGQSYSVKAVVFLSQKETDVFDKNEDAFYDLFDDKDVVKFNQLLQ
ncbi:hypothetical protein SG34_000735 [Thalassomonas viridans]|uniref:Suppressor of fused-like domain-containing protein n=1 Tax=Thalassomonas viridans TaxID=137584 RepID=A0AAE9Z3Q9_9GAMM|nr:hypothetical protein [Thalassomonas viridans]WDE05509.1 hypothetical protein SG34_000735 [Thalassomonas viridans]